MKEAWIKVFDNFKSFVGNGWLLWICFFLILILSLWKGKDKEKRSATFCLIAFFIIFNPIVYQIVGERFLSGVYWRLFWILPVVVIVSLFLTDMVSRFRNNLLRIVAGGVVCIAIAKTGTFFFNGETYCRPENEYQIPQVAIDICDEIMDFNGGAFCTIIVPDELVCYIRQYTSTIALFYGRNVWGYMNVPSAQQLEMHERMNEETIDYAGLYTAGAAYGCDFIVFHSGVRKLPDDIETYGFSLVTDVGDYKIYNLQK